MTKEEIRNLTPVERVAGFLVLSAKLATVGAKLRKNGRSDDTWTAEEETEWYEVCDQMDIWYYSLSDDERDAIRPVELILGSITRGEWLRNPPLVLLVELILPWHIDLVLRLRKQKDQMLLPLVLFGRYSWHEMVC